MRPRPWRASGWWTRGCFIGGNIQRGARRRGTENTAKQGGFGRAGVGQVDLRLALFARLAFLAAFLRGTFAPAARASDSPIAIACLAARYLLAGAATAQRAVFSLVHRSFDFAPSRFAIPACHESPLVADDPRDGGSAERLAAVGNNPRRHVRQKRKQTTHNSLSARPLRRAPAPGCI